jgi:hypothetical protein
MCRFLKNSVASKENDKDGVFLMKTGWWWRRRWYWGSAGGGMDCKLLIMLLLYDIF